MNLTKSATHRSVAGFDNTSRYQTQFEFLSLGDRLRSINQRIKNFTSINSPVNAQIERCSMMHFSIDEQCVTDARRLIISNCKDKLVFMRIKPTRHSNLTQVDLFVKASTVQLIKELMKLHFNC